MQQNLSKIKQRPKSSYSKILLLDENMKVYNILLASLYKFICMT